MKINNKKRVNRYMAFRLIVLALLFLNITILMYLGYIFVLVIFSVIALLIIVYGLLKNQFIFEYENSGQVISIKSYQWLSGGKKFLNFEMPQKKLLG